MSAIWYLLLVVLLASALRLGARARALQVLPASEESVDASHRFVVVTGVELDAATRRSASAYARARGLLVLDLVPPDLPVESALHLLSLADPDEYERDLLGAGRGAGQAILVHRDVLTRSGLGTAAGDPDGGDTLELPPADLARATQRLKHHAVEHASIAVAPGMRAFGGTRAADDLAFWSHTFGYGTTFVVAVTCVEVVLLALGPWIAPLPGVLALLAFHAHPWLSVRRSALRPRDLTANTLGRLILAPLRALELLRTSLRARSAAAGESDTLAVLGKLEAGTDQLFEPRRPDCPLCGSGALEVRVRAPDRFQHKPGTFTLESCQTCGHVFQNPRLSIDGLDYYYADFYSGSGESLMDLTFSTADDSYVARAEVVRGLHTPVRWLDIGTGHGHFCLRAKKCWPETRFDGLDMGESIEEAERRGWVARGYRGQFPVLSHVLAKRYDVVSMHHYLEHTREPIEELQAAARVLQTGGYLSIEIPDPECTYGRILGTHWLPWFQPQHQHFLTVRNLRVLLEKQGFEVVREERGVCHIPVDFTFAALSVIGELAPTVGRPWQPPAPAWRRILRPVAMTLGSPLILLGALMDRLITVGTMRWGWTSNTFRMLARKHS